MRTLQDPSNIELKKIVDQLTLEDLDITARAIARRHSVLKNASAFTRNPARMNVITESRQKQLEARAIAAKLSPSALQNRKRERLMLDNKVLALQVKRLIAAHAGLIRAVQLAGGMSALERFWKEYKEVGDAVQALDALPQKTVVVDIT
jgi:hypothetical protein